MTHPRRNVLISCVQDVANLVENFDVHYGHFSDGRSENLEGNVDLFWPVLHNLLCQLRSGTGGKYVNRRHYIKFSPHQDLVAILESTRTDNYDISLEVQRASNESVIM